MVAYGTKAVSCERNHPSPPVFKAKRMIKWVALFSTIALGLYGASMVPRPDRADAVFSGKVLSIEKLKVIQNGKTKSEWWRARVLVESWIKGGLIENVPAFVYYEQDWRTNYVTADGVSHSESSTRACPPPPNITVGIKYQFLCLERDIGEQWPVWYVPEAEWAQPK
jgi:hypothetical protein